MIAFVSKSQGAAFSLYLGLSLASYIDLDNILIEPFALATTFEFSLALIVLSRVASMFLGFVGMIFILLFPLSLQLEELWMTIL